MSDMETFSLDELGDMYTQEAAIDEATRSETIPTGNYEITIRTVNNRIAGEKSPYQGRKMFSLGCEVQREDKKPIRKYGTVSFEMYRERPSGETYPDGRPILESLSPDHEDYSAEYPLDKPARQWCQLLKVVDPKGELSIPDQVGALTGSDFRAYIMEGFKVNENKMVFAKGDDERRENLKAGYEPFNFFSNFKKP